MGGVLERGDSVVASRVDVLDACPQVGALLLHESVESGGGGGLFARNGGGPSALLEVERLLELRR